MILSEAFRSVISLEYQKQHKRSSNEQKKSTVKIA